MNKVVRRIASLVCCTIFSATTILPAAAVTLDQIVSHENAALSPAAGRISIGRDGLVYFHHQRSATEDGYLLRLTPDGNEKSGTIIHYAAHGVAANARGEYAVGEAHFAHTVTIFDKNFARLAAINTFDGSNYDAPQHVEVGASNDFYGGDVRGKRILRFSPQGKPVASIPAVAVEFRVSEKNESVYLARGGNIDCVDYEGNVRWKVPAPGVGGDTYNSWGGFDIDDNGVLYVMSPQATKVQVYDKIGNPLPTLTLQMGERAPQPGMGVVDIRVWKDEIFVKRAASTELFARYDLATGAFKKAVDIDFDKLTVDFPAQVWTAGQGVPFAIKFQNPQGKPAPHFRVWATPFGVSRYREFALQGGQLQVPPDAAGLYQIKVTPETSAQQRRAPSLYLVRDLIEIRQPGSKGTASVWTPGNRVSYARGEAVPFSVSVRVAAPDRPRELTVRLMAGTKVWAESKVTSPIEGSNVGLKLSSALTAALRPGDYSLVAVAPGLTSAPQYLTIGNGPDTSPFRLTQFGDYGTDMPFASLTPWTAPDVTGFYGRRSQQLGLNMVAERVYTTALGWDNVSKNQLEEFAKRLEKDPLGVAPEKVKLGVPFLQAMAAFGAAGVEHMPILLTNDASTTLGVGFDNRKPEQLTADIKTISGTLKDYAAFRGWDWAANWWAATAGADAATSPEQKKAYAAALAKAKADGTWDPVLDEVAKSWLNRAPAATALFNDALRAAAPGKVTAVSGPYRNAYAYPPITFSNVDEVDLQFQSEQMYPPYSFLHAVDFYKRPGKPAWAHPEIWNDSGTGEQITRELFGLAMRGADGVGFSGGVGWGPQPEDSRSSANGISSAYRASLGVLRQYGPWLTSLKNNDRIAIVASPRMFMLDEWANTWGTHFARVMEAYDSCLHAHQPASIVFVDDMKPETLSQYKAVLIVGQRFEMEPMLQANLKKAAAAGTKIFYDGTCRESLVKGYTPLGISFDKMEHDPHTWGDDPAFAPYRFPAYVRANLPALRAKLNAVLPPVAETENEEVLLTERASGEGRYLFALNNTTPELDPGQMWRFSLFVTTRVPVEASIKLAASSLAPGSAVYDVFAQKRVTPAAGAVRADLRDLPARVFAVLPAPITRVGLRGPKSIAPGQPFNCGAWVQDAKGAAFKTAIPVRIRVLDFGGRVLHEQFLAAEGADGAPAILSPTLDATGSLTLEATELFSGKNARMTIPITPAQLPVALNKAAVNPAEMDAKATLSGAPAAPAESEFGPHLRDIALSRDGTLAIMNAMNWNENLYGLDVSTGKVRWQKRIGQAFSFAPQTTDAGLAVQGFDFTSPYSYYLYLADSSGAPARRFGLYGLSRRLPQRFLATIYNDRMNQFAVAPDSSWVASCGDLGLAVWDKSGKLLWKRDDYKTNRAAARFDGLANWGAARLVTPVIAAQNAGSLLTVQDMEAITYNAETGEKTASLRLATGGETRKILVSADGKTTAILATTYGGRLFILQGGKLVEAIPVVADDIALSADGNRIAAVNSTQLSVYEIGKGLRWVFNGDEILHNPRLAADGRVAVASQLGMLYVLDTDGQLKLQRDMKSLPVPQWLPGGDLLVATWSGDTVRLDGSYAEKWRTHLKPQASDMRGKLLAPEKTPTEEINSWTNAQPQAAGLTPNLLAQTAAQVTLTINTRKGDPLPTLSDGKAEAAAQPLTKWGDINWLGEGTALNWIEMEMPKHDVTVTGLTLFEDPAHPESWLRDGDLEYFDETRNEWSFAMPLLSNSPVHTHTLPQPVKANRWRIALPSGVVGNVRLGEIVLNGTAQAK